VEYVEILLRLIASLNDERVEYVLIGGAALNVHGLLRATEDIDFFVEPDEANIERLKRALRAVWDDDAIDDISADELCGDYPALRYGPPTGTVFLDVMTRLGEKTQWDDLESEEVELRGVGVRVATPKTLFEMKKDTVRPRDRADAQALANAFDVRDD